MVNKKLFSTRELIQISFMTALIAALSQLSIPMPSGVPVTMQIFAVSLAGFLLKPAHSLACISIYILAGILGIPVFSGFTGGIERILSPAGGFIIGFYFTALFSALTYKNRVFLFISVILLHITGIIHYSIITGTDIGKSVLIISLPYFIKDLLSVILAYTISVKIKKKLV